MAVQVYEGLATLSAWRTLVDDDHGAERPVDEPTEECEVAVVPTRQRLEGTVVLPGNVGAHWRSSVLRPRGLQVWRRPRSEPVGLSLRLGVLSRVEAPKPCRERMRPVGTENACQDVCVGRGACSDDSVKRGGEFGADGLMFRDGTIRIVRLPGEAGRRSGEGGLVRLGSLLPNHRLLGDSMTIQRYSVNQHPIQTLLTWIESDEIAIPEIQRPFVWNATQVRDFIDSLYFGYPVGYLIAWRNPSVRLKDGTQSAGKRILIDGQQRVKALLAAMLGRSLVDKSYRKVRIAIAFHPGEERFEVTNSVIRRDRTWLADIATLFAPDTKLLRVVDTYCEDNGEANRDEIYERIERLRGIRNNLLGLIELNADLDVETVSEIFVRINSQGVSLNAADFAMSKMAANERYNGHQLRKCVDYFCHLAVAPETYADLANDSEFAGTQVFSGYGMAQVREGGPV